MNNANQPAFGFVDNRSSSYEDNEVHYGLTKRELAAFMAMQGLCANSVPGRHHMPDELTNEAIELADLMIKKLSQ